MSENDPSEQARQRPHNPASPVRQPVGLAIALENVTAEALDQPSSAGEAPALTGAGGRPRVTASGRGAVAEQILQIAFDRGIKVRQDADLAEILAAVEVESEIPLAALAGVAEILRYLYQTDKAEEAVPPRAGDKQPKEEKAP